YKRLVPGFGSPTYACWGVSNRSALVRVPLPKPGKEPSCRIEYRAPDPACNPYLAFALMLCAGLRGIEHEYELGAEATNDIYAMTDRERAELGIAPLPESLPQALGDLERSELACETLGEHLFEWFVANKR